MKLVLSVLLGLSVLTGALPTFAQETKSETKTEKKHKKKKKSEAGEESSKKK
jgi:hypothetical protein